MQLFIVNSNNSSLRSYCCQAHRSKDYHDMVSVFGLSSVHFDTMEHVSAVIFSYIEPPNSEYLVPVDQRSVFLIQTSSLPAT